MNNDEPAPDPQDQDDEDDEDDEDSNPRPVPYNDIEPYLEASYDSGSGVASDETPSNRK